MYLSQTSNDLELLKGWSLRYVLNKMQITKERSCSFFLWDYLTIVLSLVCASQQTLQLFFKIEMPRLQLTIVISRVRVVLKAFYFSKFCHLKSLCHLEYHWLLPHWKEPQMEIFLWTWKRSWLQKLEESPEKFILRQSIPEPFP